MIDRASMGRPSLSAAQKAELWQRGEQGPSLSEIGQTLGKHARSIHWVAPSNGGCIPPVRRRSRWALTLAERQSRFTILVKVPGKDTASVVTALSAQIRHLPAVLRRSLTWDRGMELAQHK